MDYNKWKKSWKYSIAFYQNKLPFKTRQFNHLFQLPHYFEEFIDGKDKVKIADLGCGMFSTTGSTWPTADIEIYPSDILAAEYNELLKKYKVIPVIPVEKQDMECLTYEKDFFDVVHCVNALDHCFNPIQALKEMFRVCKPGGWIYLRHFLNNAEFQKYHGSHLWNINESGGDCVIWNKEELHLLSYFFSGFKTATRKDGAKPGTVVISKLRKAYV
jgi:ubiquinone/menaquinone biosynthesis C-methylase UbiE